MFSELCPLFNTGVYGEVTLPEASLSSVATTVNIHHGFCFGRKVVVTDAYVVKGTGTWTTAAIFNLMHLTTASISVASQTLVGSYAFITSSASQTMGHCLTMNITNTTFDTTDIVSTSNESEVTGGKVAVIIRYKDA